jgi:hypothetical protein
MLDIYTKAMAEPAVPTSRSVVAFVAVLICCWSVSMWANDDKEAKWAAAQSFWESAGSLVALEVCSRAKGNPVEILLPRPGAMTIQGIEADMRHIQFLESLDCVDVETAVSLTAHPSVGPGQIRHVYDGLTNSGLLYIAISVSSTE